MIVNMVTHVVQNPFCKNGRIWKPKVMRWLALGERRMLDNLFNDFKIC